jgi:hypothetical protein
LATNLRSSWRTVRNRIGFYGISRRERRLRR